MVLTENYDIDGTTGEPVALPLTRGPATGHRWVLDLPTGIERLEDGPGEPGRELGGGSGAALRVRAPVGEHVIVARLVRPWESEPVRVVRIRLRVR